MNPPPDRLRLVGAGREVQPYVTAHSAAYHIDPSIRSLMAFAFYQLPSSRLNGVQTRLLYGTSRPASVYDSTLGILPVTIRNNGTALSYLVQISSLKLPSSAGEPRGRGGGKGHSFGGACNEWMNRHSLIYAMRNNKSLKIMQ